MRTRTTLSWCLAAVAVYLACGVLIAQRGAARAKVVAPEAVRTAEQEIDKAAAARGIKLTDAARQALAKEAVHQEATSPAPNTAPVTGALSDDQLSRLLSPLADAPQGARLDVRDVETRVLDSKTKAIVATLPADIRDHEKASGKVVPDEVRLKMTEDLTKQSEALSKSGLAVDAIRQRNEQTLRAIDSTIGTRPYSPQNYQVAMLEIFDTVVPLSILSTPDGASVSVEGNPIGSTNIVDKPFKPKTYKFKFRLTGYADADRDYTVAAGLLSDSFTQVLTPVSTPGSSATTGPSREPVDKESRWKLSVGYILGGIIVVLLGVLFWRRR